MRTSKIISVEPEDEAPFLTTVADFLRENRHAGSRGAGLLHSSDIRAIRAMRAGDSPLTFGNVRVWVPSKRERQYVHVLASLLEQGRSEKVAKRIAGAVANKTRAKLARQGRAPKLVSDGGTRRQWYPGKRRDA